MTAFTNPIAALNSKWLKRFVASVYNVTRSLAGSIAALAINYILLHQKSETLLSAYVYCLTAVALLQLISAWGGKEFAVKELSTRVAEQNRVMSELLTGRLLICIALALLLILIPGMKHKWFIVALLLLRTITTVFEALVVVRKKFGALLLSDIISNGIFLLLLLLDGNTNNIVLLFYEWLGIETIRLCVNLYLFRKDISPLFRFVEAISQLKKSFLFFVVAVAGFCCSRADLYVLGLNMSPANLNRYSILLSFIILCQVMFTAFIGANASGILRYGHSAFKLFTGFTLKAGLGLAIIGTAGTSFFSFLFFGERPEALFLCLLFINLLAFSSTFSSIYHFTRLNRQNVILKVIVLAALVNLGLSPLLIPLAGITGAFAANTACALATALLFIAETRKE